MEIYLNGEKKKIGAERTLQELLNDYGIESGSVVVEYNETVVPREEFGNRKIAAGDRIEIVRFVGGGRSSL